MIAGGKSLGMFGWANRNLAAQIGNQQSANRQWLSAPAVIRTPNQQIMRRFEGHQQGETKRDKPVFTESAAVKVSYIWLRLSTSSRHNRAILVVIKAAPSCSFSFGFAAV